MPNLADASRIAIGAALALVLSGFLGCTLTSNLDEYESDDCPSGQKVCKVQGKDTCVSIRETLYGCGSTSSCLSCNVRLENAVTSCDRNNECAVSSCEPGWDDCERAAADGCETNINSSTAHCGGCGVRCPNQQNSVALCENGRCTINCSSGFRNCDVNESNGCEVKAETDVNNCGECGVKCNAATQDCVGGKCVAKPI